MKKTILLTLTLLLGTGCTSVDVRPVNASIHLTRVCIQRNAQVKVSDFIDVVRDGFGRHGIATSVFSGDTTPPGCEYVVTYTAYRKWDLAPYLARAELRIEKDGYQIAYGEFHLVGGGGLDPAKWNSTHAKIDPVIDKMLSGLD